VFGVFDRGLETMDWYYILRDFAFICSAWHLAWHGAGNTCKAGRTAIFNKETIYSFIMWLFFVFWRHLLLDQEYERLNKSAVNRALEVMQSTGRYQLVILPKQRYRKIKATQCLKDQRQDVNKP
jgi:hypothetical protein